jgi:hypothetical protein
MEVNMINFDSKIMGFILAFTLLFVYGAIAAQAGAAAALAFLAKTVFIIIFGFAHLYAYELLMKGFYKLSR